MQFLIDLTVYPYSVGLLVELHLLELLVVCPVELFLGFDSSFALLSNCPLPLLDHLSELVLNKLVSLPLLPHTLFNVAVWILRTERSQSVVIQIHTSRPV